MTRPDHDQLLQHLREVRASLEDIDPTRGEETVERLSHARARLDAALDEAMALAALQGASLRTVAGRAGVAPNTVPPRLARTSSLSPYTNADGKVASAGVERARYDRERGTTPPPPAPSQPAGVEPLRFRRRRSD